jgi:hypothetical protein
VVGGSVPTIAFVVALFWWLKCSHLWQANEKDRKMNDWPGARPPRNQAMQQVLAQAAPGQTGGQQGQAAPRQNGERQGQAQVLIQAAPEQNGQQQGQAAPRQNGQQQGQAQVADTMWLL